MCRFSNSEKKGAMNVANLYAVFLAKPYIIEFVLAWQDDAIAQ